MNYRLSGPATNPTSVKVGGTGGQKRGHCTRQTFQLTDIASGPRPARPAFAIKRTPCFQASAPVEARGWGARVVHHLAVRPGEAFGAGAAVRVGGRVLASAPVQARFMRPAVV